MTGQTKKPATARFALGDVTRTTAAQRAIKETAGVTTVELVCRHMGGDWGAISDDARLVNQAALDPASPWDIVTSCYPCGDYTIVVTTMYVDTPSLCWTDICLYHELDDDDGRDTMEFDDVIADLELEAIKEEGGLTPEITKGILT
jgi:hypothetical protein